MKNIITIWKKELRDTIRDRRTLLAMVVMPMVLMPLLLIGIGKFTEYQVKSLEEKVLKIGLVNSQASPEFTDFLKSNDKLEILEEFNGLEDALKERAITAAVTVPSDFKKLISEQQLVPITITHNSINTDAGTALSRLNKMLADYNSSLLQQRFDAAGLSSGILTGLTAVPVDLATEKERGGFGLSFFIPLFVVMWAVVGGQYTAIDVSSGEKERKTLEALFLTPVTRMNIVLGKFLAVSTVALVSVVVALGSMYVAMTSFGGNLFNYSAGVPGTTDQINFSVAPAALGLMFGISLLLVVMFSALQLAIAIFAKSYKEAQSYIGPSYLVIILPTVMINTLPNFKPAAWFFCLPVVNAIIVFKELLIGVYDWQHIAITAATSLVYALGAIYLATRIYTREKVLFKN